MFNNFIPTALLFCLLTHLFPAQTIVEQYDISVTNVTVWVKVTDKSGNPIEGLTENEFEIYEDDNRSDITCFEEIKASGLSGLGSQQATQTAPQKSDRLSKRKMVLLLDLHNTSQAEYLFILPKLCSFLLQPHPDWQVMLVVISEQQSVVPMVRFTDDFQMIASKLKELRANSARDMRMINKKRQITDMLRVDQSERTIMQAYRLAQQFAEEDKRSTRQSLNSIQAISDGFSKIGTSEHIVMLFVSGGLNSEPGRIYYELINKVVADLGLDANPTDWALTVPMSQRPQGFDLLSEIRKTIGRLNNYNITMYTVSTRGMINPDLDNITQSEQRFITNDQTYLHDFNDSMGQLANETGGKSFANSLNFPRAFSDIAFDLSHYYLICYSQPIHKKPDEYHKIKVRLKMKGLNVRHRSGYLG